MLSADTESNAISDRKVTVGDNENVCDISRTGEETGNLQQSELEAQEECREALLDIGNKLYLNLQIKNNVRNKQEAEETIKSLVGDNTPDCQLSETKCNQQNRMRLAFEIILRLVLPLANGVAKGLKGIRDVRIIRALKNLAGVANTISMGLSSVQVGHHIDPILKMMKLKRGECIESLPDNSSIHSGTPTFRDPRIAFSSIKSNYEEAEKCVTLNVLAEPPPGEPIRADIVLIHGLHGSLANTWKQGVWGNERTPVKFQRPPKPPLRPPKRPRHSRANIFLPPHKLKRARFDDKDHFSLDAHDKDWNTGSSDLSTWDDDFSTFRLRMEEYEYSDSSAAGSPNKPKDSDDVADMENYLENKSEYSKCWPGDWLPLDCPGVRVIAVNYTTDPYLWRPVWRKKEPRTNLAERSRQMAELLIAKRVGYGHPIVWVGHSKGGIFVKQIIVDAWENGRPAFAPLWRSARGVFFYSVPHRGSHLASINPPLLRRSVELIEIEKHNKYLLDLHQRFAGLYQMGYLKVEVFSFVETALTLMSVLYLRIVGVDSADPGVGEVCGLHLDHREICKPRSRECILYKELVKMINKVC